MKKKNEIDLREFFNSVGSETVASTIGSGTGTLANTLLPGSGPFVGGIIKATLRHGFKLFGKKNINELHNLLEKDLNALEVPIKPLADNQDFLRNIIDANFTALRDGSENKLLILRNALLNSIVNPPEKAMQIIFFQYINEFTDWHIALLKLFDEPKSFLSRNELISKKFKEPNSRSLKDLVHLAYPELEDSLEFFPFQIYNDLINRGLVRSDMNVDFLNGAMEKNKVLARRTTTWGSEFLNFISEPKISRKNVNNN